MQQKWVWTLELYAPKHLFPTEELVIKCNEIAKQTGAKITITDNVAAGVKKC